MDDILVLKEKFNDVLFSSKNIGNWVERRTDYTFNDVLALEEKISYSLVLSKTNE